MNTTPSGWIALIGGIIGGIVLAVVACPVGHGRTWSLDRPVAADDEAATGLAEDRDG